MKKPIALILSVLLVLSLGACSGKNDGTEDLSTTAPSATAPAGSEEISYHIAKAKLDSMEYTLYQNIFYKKMADSYVDQKFSKDGVFASIRDQYNKVTRYYVWGFADNTRCCDFQWELVLPEGTDIPANGSYVSVKGTFTKDSAALDGYWLTDVSLKVEEKYEKTEYDYDLTTMSATLARVQLANMLYDTAYFGGKTMRVFGRALSTSQLQHPYYDEAWSLDFKYDKETPAIGTDLVLGGVFTATDTGSYLQVEDYNAF